MARTRVLITFLLFIAPSFAQTITHSVLPNGNDVYRIDQPNVRQPLTEYPGVPFKGKDLVTVRAGGCVQTGGLGATWKRYVDPSGPHSGSLYHGTIWIPGTIPNPERIAASMSCPVFVPNSDLGNPEHHGRNELFLRLGYEDDDYSDNSYVDHDDGTEDQCKGVGPAWVEVEVKHNVSQIPYCGPPADFDLTWSNESLDPNYLPRNPEWAYQVSHHSPPNPDACASFTKPCTKQFPAMDEPGFPNCNICNLSSVPAGKPHGHVNWFPVNFDGPVYWNRHSEDDDYNYWFIPPSENALTSKNMDADLMEGVSGSIGVEFDSDETIDHFVSAWWNSFHNAVDNNGSVASTMTNHDVDLIGLLGLDCEHGCVTELHPVFAIAIHLKDDPNDDTWAIFVRNWGNEGFCSKLTHYLYVPGHQLQFHFRRPGATGAQLLNASFYGNENDIYGPNLTSDASGDAWVSFDLPDSSSRPMAHGELHLKWTGAPTLPSPSPALKPVSFTSDFAEDRLEELIKKMSPAQEKIFVAEMEKLPKPRKHDIAIQPGHGTYASGSLPSDGVDPRKSLRDQYRVDAICAAYQGSVPGFADICKPKPKEIDPCALPRKGDSATVAQNCHLSQRPVEVKDVQRSRN